jgi:23S rRNA pseudouridine2605 synthase
VRSPMETIKNTQPETLRLNRFLSQCGLGARRKCDELIRSGHIAVNGQKVIALGTKIGPGDTVEYCGKNVTPVRRLEYWAYHKPSGIMVTKTDPQGRVTLYQALSKNGFDAHHLNYVGRLDYTSEGLLLLTNDGSLIHALTHPRYRIKKVYRVAIDRLLIESDRQKLLEGITSEGQLLSAGAVRIAASAGGGHWYEIDLYEGKNRQVRRMFESLHYQVVRLLRIRFASVKLEELASGAARPLTPKEIAALKSAGFPAHPGRKSWQGK